ncbi:MAG TPA: DegT/DnrJ/EryC1/StrS family aminotransferase [Thermotogota bacterium]|nr:DegT/DnrJ/EryC1/StrS family aminotransferase [Thermotogota bacterium]HRW92002.1 DegT/DnrJ/EryC1/StrS family aminotransferase [Thermotogota bacterium]
MSELALFGGKKVRDKVFPAYRVIGEEEKKAALRVLESGILSRYLGSWHPDFYGGPEVKALEEKWAKYFGVKHAVSVNSATSALYVAAGACGIGPGDEVIVSPYTMSASATAPLIFNAIPVFADIEPDFFCLDPQSVERNITPRTRAIIVVDIFGQPYDADAINAIAKQHGLKVIEDAAQAPGAMHGNRFAGTLGDIGVFSLNYHKHIHTGEGGIAVTNDDALAEKMRMIRNHAEAVVDDRAFPDLVNMVGFNLRMTELEAALASEQLEKLDSLLAQRRDNVFFLNQLLSNLPGIYPARERPGCKHAFYVHPIRFVQQEVGVSRKRFVKALVEELSPIELREHEGIALGEGYVKPLYLQSMYQKRIAFGKKGCPFHCPWYQGNVSYEKGICPVCERMHFEELITHEMIRPPMAHHDVEDVARAFEKVWKNREELHDA